jgi:alcohol dehydrogenase (NADP+)
MHNLQFKNGDSIPQLGLGTWKSDPGEVYKAVRTAIRIGYRHIDCAFVYGNEAEIGNALTDAMKEGEVTREELFITSKLWNSEHDKNDVLPALKKTIKDLKLDYLDLYLIHWPVSVKRNTSFPLKPEDFISPEDMPITETWQGMIDAKGQGLSKHIGVSNFSINRLQELMDMGKEIPEMNQVESHPYMNQHELINFCSQHQILLTAYSPLGSRDRSSGMKADDEPNLLEDPVLKKMAETHHCSVAQVILSWNIHRGVAVIPKSVNEGRLKENLSASDVSLSENDMKQINELDRGFRFVNGSFWTVEGSPYSLKYLWG